MAKVLTIKDKQQIPDVLGSMVECGTLVTLWQLIDNRRVLSPAIIKKINYANWTVILHCLNRQNLFNFDEKVTLYCCSNNKNLVFKSHLEKNKREFLIMDLPNFVKIIEKRTAMRFFFRDKKIPVLCGNTSNIDYTAKHTQKVQAKLFDISQTGCCFYIDPLDTVEFKTGDSLQLFEIAEEIVKSVKGRVKYSQVVKRHDGSTQIKIGVEFQHKIDIKSVVSKIYRYISLTAAA